MGGGPFDYIAVNAASVGQAPRGPAADGAPWLVGDGAHLGHLRRPRAHGPPAPGRPRGEGRARARVRDGLRLGVAGSPGRGADRGRPLRGPAGDRPAVPGGIRPVLPPRAGLRGARPLARRIVRPPDQRVRGRHLGRSPRVDPRGVPAPATGGRADLPRQQHAVDALRARRGRDARHRRAATPALRHAPLRVARRPHHRVPPGPRRLDPAAAPQRLRDPRPRRVPGRRWMRRPPTASWRGGGRTAGPTRRSGAPGGRPEGRRCPHGTPGGRRVERGASKGGQ